MRKTKTALRLGIAAGVLLAFATGVQADLDDKYDPKKLDIPEMGKIKAIEPERFEMNNGIVVYLLENHDLPLVRGTAYSQASAAWDPADKVGLASMTGEVMRSGGSAEHDGDWLDDRLASIGAQISASVGIDFGTGSFRCLTENTDEVLGLMAEIVRQPTFPEDKIEVAKVAARQAIASRNDEMIPIVQRVAGQALHGKDSPYARTTEYATIAAITRDDLVAFHKTGFVPNRMIIAIYGDFESSVMKESLSKAFADWPRDDTPTPEMPPMPGLGEPRVVFAPKDDVTNSAILLAHMGFKRLDATDAADMEVVNTALGGGFRSRLFNRIRTQRGLAYATAAFEGAGWFRPGVLGAVSLTRSDSTMVARDLLMEEVTRITVEAVSEEEMVAAKSAVENSFVFNFENPADVLFRAAFYELAGYPQDYLEKHQGRLAKVDEKTMLAAAQNHIHPGNLLTIIVGKEEDFDRSLESLGLPVERVDITIPPPPSAGIAEAATPEALAKGNEWLTSAATAAGGAAAWAAVTAVAIEREATLSMQGQSIGITGTTAWVLPDKRRDVLKLPFGEMVQGSDGTSGWQQAAGQVQDLPNLVEQHRKGYETSLYHVFGYPDAIQVQALSEPRTIDGVSYNVAYVISEVVQDWMLYFDADGNLARMEHQGEGPQGPALQTEVYSDWRQVGGGSFPHAREVLLDGQPFLTEQIITVEFNPSLEEGQFAKPSS
jgi:predicted Zn-dependent peptidase